MADFHRYIGIDYSGAKTASCSLSGLRIFQADSQEEPVEVFPPPSSQKYWSRRRATEWLIQALKTGPTTLVGINHAFSFPLRYFEVHQIPPHWPSFLKDFQHHWPTDAEHTYVDFVRDGLLGTASQRWGNSRWRRLTDILSRAKSPFHFDVQGSVAKSTHSGLPWLLRLRLELGDRVQFWPFDGWRPQAGCSIIAEVYPALVSRRFPSEDRNPHQQDAYAIARWMQESDQTGQLSNAFQPCLSSGERAVSQIEGWILGLMPKFDSQPENRLAIVLDDLSGSDTASFLSEHLNELQPLCPRESRHALDLEGLRQPGITFWSAWLEDRLAGCCALKELDRTHAEIKSMRVAKTVRRQGFASALMTRLLDVARDRDYQRLSLETDSMAFFEPARRLYQKFGFQETGPFGRYREDPNSTFMTRIL